ncbi:somatomedin-B and thrombospondin type-1 domain-containing protein isoform X1 [Polypterus senegalus]|uniref:somatomedin-B and thrombospondin type-1 domain-containing protein isoform X1 n=1 Tax=Polypterus senegalus TaxID=55291 RepID=UPI0019666636|nr:somatomedin-B and thrombospondin type-1 domain-containing protein isoform X1 [Polypterus senegalus]
MALSHGDKCLFVCGILAMMVLLVQRVETGCAHRESPKCCPGRNNDCFELNRRMTICYCDTYCQKTGDCCEDYPTVCHISAAIDCVVSSWGSWSECSQLCGAGSKERTRQVITPPRNGGMPCPDLKQRRGCFGQSPVCSTAKEVAKILPHSFKRNFKDPWRRPHMLMKEEKPSYCAYFQLKQASAACRMNLWSSHMTREQPVCVECQGDAMGRTNRCEGDGLETTRTFWTAASLPGCQGSWVRERLQEDCRCPEHSFIFV